MVGGAHQLLRRLQIEQPRIFQKRLLVFFRILPHAQRLLRCIADDLVVHVSDVHHVAQLESALPQKTAQDVERYKRPEVADVAVVVHRRPAGIHAHFLVVQRCEFLQLAGERVKDFQRHGRDKATIVNVSRAVI